MEMEEFDHYNPGFDNSLSNGSTYTMQLPNDKMALFVANKYPILNECVQQLLESANAVSKTVEKTPAKKRK